LNRSITITFRAARFGSGFNPGCRSSARGKASPGRLIDSDGVNGAERTVRQSEGDDMFDSVEDLFPGSMKGRGCLFPGKPASPSSQKQHISVGQLMFAVAPRNFFNDHRFAAAAVDAPHGIKQKNQETHKGMNSKRLSGS